MGDSELISCVALDTVLSSLILMAHSGDGSDMCGVWELERRGRLVLVVGGEGRGGRGEG